MNNTNMTTKESMEAYVAIRDEKNPYDFTKEEWKVATPEEKQERYKKSWEWRREHEKRVADAINAIVPEVGMGCTIIYYSDRRAATVTKIISRSKIEVRFNKTKCIDYYSGEYEILPELEECMGVDVFTKRRNGLWIMDGHKTKDGVRLRLDFQDHYIDPNF